MVALPLTDFVGVWLNVSVPLRLNVGVWESDGDAVWLCDNGDGVRESDGVREDDGDAVPPDGVRLTVEKEGEEDSLTVALGLREVDVVAEGVAVG